MIIEHLIGVIILFFIFIGAIVSIFGWIAADERNDKERKYNMYLAKENSRLSNENANLKTTIELFKQKVATMEEHLKETTR